MKTVLFRDELTDQIRELHSILIELQTQLQEKDKKINSLEEKLTTTEVQRRDENEQYSRRANVSGLVENDQGENLEEKVLTLFDKHMNISPPIDVCDLAREFRELVLNFRKQNQTATTCFRSQRTHDAVFRKRTALKSLNDAIRSKGQISTLTRT